MKRISLLIIGLLAIVVTTLQAQVDFGVRFGVSYSALTQRIDEGYVSGGKAGFSIAGLADIPIYKGLSFRPEVAYLHQGGNYYSQPVLSEMAAYNKYKYYSIQIPLDLAYTFNVSDIRLSVYAGPALDFSLFGKMKTRDNDIESNIQFGAEKEKNLRTFDLGVKVGLAVEYSKFFFSIDAICGTLDRRSVKRDGESKLLQNNITFSLGYFFRKD